MAFRETLQIGDVRLKALNQEILDFNSEKVKQIIEDLTETMRQNGLIGMAGPQIGENYQIFVTEPRESPYRTADQSDELRIFINPKIIETSKDECIIFEGCGSVLNATLFGPVMRPNQITLEAFDETGKKFRFKSDGILGRVIQHEYDHLIGVEFTEKVYDYKQLMSVDFYKSNIKGSEQQLKNSIITLKEFTIL